LPDSVKKILEDKKAMEFVNGVGLHWYMAPPLEDITQNGRVRAANAAHPVYKDPPDTLDKLHKHLTEARKDGFIFGTEACNGFYPDPDLGEANGASARIIFGKNGTTHVVKGSFQRGEVYAEDILADLSHHVTGWTDWNLVLDANGGPNWASNVVDAPILMITKDEYIRQPMFYYMAHFSRFLPPGTSFMRTRKVNIGKPGTFEFVPGWVSATWTSGVSATWPGNFFLEVFYDDVEKHFVIVVLNRCHHEDSWTVVSGDEAVWGEIHSQSIQTVLWKPRWLDGHKDLTKPGKTKRSFSD